MQMNPGPATSADATFPCGPNIRYINADKPLSYRHRLTARSFNKLLLLAYVAACARLSGHQSAPAFDGLLGCILLPTNATTSGVGEPNAAAPAAALPSTVQTPGQITLTINLEQVRLDGFL